MDPEGVYRKFICGSLSDKQLKKLGQGCNILVVAPGRLLSILRRGVFYSKQPSTSLGASRQVLNPSNRQFIVYDEADKLMSRTLKDESFSKSKQTTFEQEIDEIESFISTRHKGVYRWYFSSQSTNEQIERARRFKDRGEGGHVNIDFDMPHEHELQRYALVEQTFVQCGETLDPNTPSSQQKMRHFQH